MRRTLLAAFTLGVIGAAGCSGDPSAPALSDAAAHQLQADVLAVTTSAAAQHWTAAVSGLNKLRTDLAAARAAGTVSAARAATISAAVAAVSSDIAASSSSAVPPAASTTSSAPSSTIPAPTPTPPKAPPKPTKKGKHGGAGGDGG